MPYNPADHPYPAHRHGHGGALRVVTNADEDALAHDEGFVAHPSMLAAQTSYSAPTVRQTTRGGKKAEKPAPEAPAPAPVEVVPAPEFDRAAALALLEAANFEVDPETTDDELKEALAELAKG